MTVRAKHRRFAVDQSALRRQPADRLHDPRKPVVEVRAPAGPHLDALALLPGEDSVAVVFHLVQPARARGRDADENRLTELDEAGRRFAPGGTPQHAPVCRGHSRAQLAPRLDYPSRIALDPPVRRLELTLPAVGSASVTAAEELHAWTPSAFSSNRSNDLLAYGQLGRDLRRTTDVSIAQ